MTQPGEGLQPSRLVVRTEAVPAVELEGFCCQLGLALCGQPRHDGVDDCVAGGFLAREGVVAAEAGCDLQRLAPVLAQSGERLQQELLVGDRVAYVQCRVPGGKHREVVLVEVLDGLRVVHGQLVVGDLVDPRMHDLAQQLPTGLTTDRLGDYSDGLLGFDEAERHLSSCSSGSHEESVAKYVPDLTEKLRFPLVAGWRGWRQPVWVRDAASGPAASSRAIRSSSLSSSSPLPTASSSAAAYSISSRPSVTSSSVSRRPASFESSRRMMASSRSIADS